MNKGVEDIDTSTVEVEWALALDSMRMNARKSCSDRIRRRRLLQIFCLESDMARSQVLISAGRNFRGSVVYKIEFDIAHGNLVNRVVCVECVSWYGVHCCVLRESQNTIFTH